MNTGMATFASQGYAVIPALIDDEHLAFVQGLVTELVSRYRAGDAAALSVGVTIGEVSRQHPHRNPGVDPQQYPHEPFIIGDLIALDARFAQFISQASIWRGVAELLGCAPAELLFHFCNLTRKPSAIGPAVGWHRDADNRYFASDDARTLRMLIPLQVMSVHNGGTAVVPGSHRQADADIAAAIYPGVAPGAGLALHAGTLHGGSPNRSQRERDVIVVQFGVRSSTLRCKADEVMALSTREKLLAYHPG